MRSSRVCLAKYALQNSYDPIIMAHAGATLSTRGVVPGCGCVPVGGLSDVDVGVNVGVNVSLYNDRQHIGNVSLAIPYHTT